jgi:hypothetical protein
MRKAVLLAVYALVCPLLQADDTIFTNQMANGRMWLGMDETRRLMYVGGVHDSLSFAAIHVVNSDKAKPRWAVHFTIGDYVNELNAMYKDGEHIRIPIPYLVDYCTTKLKGETTKAELDILLISIRKQVSEWK